LAKLVTAVGRPFDIIIEDASHASHHQQIALGVLFPHLRSGGLYIIEDLHWQDPGLEKPNVPKTNDLLKKLQILGEFESPFLSDVERAYLRDHVDRLSLYDSLTLELCSDPGLLRIDDANDAIAVIRKK